MAAHGRLCSSMATLVRIGVLICAVLVSAASARSTSPSSPSGSNGRADLPVPQPMPSHRALGLWKSSFGAVKIQSDGSGKLMGVWVYQRAGREIVGFFSGPIDGNVLSLSWEEPSDAEPLRGSGYLVFDPSGRTFSGKWWSGSRDREGDWTGWRAPGAPVPGNDLRRGPDEGMPTAPFGDQGPLRPEETDTDWPEPTRI